MANLNPETVRREYPAVGALVEAFGYPERVASLQFFESLSVCSWKKDLAPEIMVSAFWKFYLY